MTMTESALRRLAARKGVRVLKSRVRNPHTNDHGHWQIVDSYNTVIWGVSYDMKFDDCVAVVKALPDAL